MHLNCPWLEKILEHAGFKWLEMHLNCPPRLEKFWNMLALTSTHECYYTWTTPHSQGLIIIVILFYLSPASLPDHNHHPTTTLPEHQHQFQLTCYVKNSGPRGKLPEDWPADCHTLRHILKLILIRLTFSNWS